MRGLKKILDTAKNVIHGIAAAPGLIIGNAYLFTKEQISITEKSIDDIDEAILNFHEALDKSKKELNKVFNVAKEKMGEARASIFEAQIMILDDPVLIDNIEKRIEFEKMLPEFIVNDEISKYQKLMIVSSESYMKERALDIEDIKNRIIRNLQKKRWQSRIKEDVIVVGDSLTPADTILLSRQNIKGFITDRGGLTSHAAIIARSLDLPAVVATHNATERIKENDLLIVDGFHGIILINPTEEHLEYFNEKINHLKKINEELKELNSKPAKTTDGYEITLMANVDVSGEIEIVKSNGAKGIGLYRTEQIIEELGELPDEDEQTKIYTNLSNRIYPDTLIIRAFDIGGDKVKQLSVHEANPFLGLRGIRFLLENIALFKTQIKSVLKASINKNIQFMLPMVSTIDEIKKAKIIIHECKSELHKNKIHYDHHLKVGIMVEVPSTALMIKEYSAEVDFFSIGTNDLIQYLMAVDRGNDFVADLYQEFHPSVIKTISQIISESKKVNIPVSICGEMASDTLAIPLLVGLGLNTLSLSPSLIPSIKRTIRSISYKSAIKIAEDCISFSSEDAIVTYLQKYFKDNLIQRTRNIL